MALILVPFLFRLFNETVGYCVIQPHILQCPLMSPLQRPAISHLIILTSSTTTLPLPTVTPPHYHLNHYSNRLTVALPL